MKDYDYWFLFFVIMVGACVWGATATGSGMLWGTVGTFSLCAIDASIGRRKP